MLARPLVQIFVLVCSSGTNISTSSRESERNVPVLQRKLIALEEGARKLVALEERARKPNAIG